MSRNKFPSDSNRYTVSFTDGMKEQIKAAAMANNRTLNAEIVHRLQESFQCGDLANLSNTTIKTWERLIAEAITALCQECRKKDEQHQG